jgi:hypothetical protein
MGSYYSTSKSDQEFYRIHALRPLPKNKFSKYRGVQKSNSKDRPYRVSFNFKGVRYYFGNYETEIEAAKVYNESVLRIIGELAILNQIDEQEAA